MHARTRASCRAPVHVRVARWCDVNNVLPAHPSVVVAQLENAEWAFAATRPAAKEHSRIVDTSNRNPTENTNFGAKMACRVCSDTQKMMIR